MPTYKQEGRAVAGNDRPMWGTCNTKLAPNHRATSE